jgi:hypothetical protein
MSEEQERVVTAIGSRRKPASADRVKRTLLGIEIPRDELALRIAIACLHMRPRKPITATEALDQLAASQPDIIDGFRRSADAAVLYFHERIQAGTQPS